MSHMYSLLCLHSAQTLVFCRCVHAEYNNNALNIPQALECVCYAVFTGYNTHTKVKKERHRKSEFGSSISSCRFVSLAYGSMPIPTMGGTY